MKRDEIIAELKSFSGSVIPDIKSVELLLNDWVQSESLKRHITQVAQIMRYYAQKKGYKSDIVDMFTVAGLLHDCDYEKHPDLHPDIIIEYGLKNMWHKDILNAIAGHAVYYEVDRESEVAKVLFATDELSGFINAYSLMKGGVQNINGESVIKKLKDKSFASKVNRSEIDLAVDELGMSKDDWVDFVIKAMSQ